MRPELLTTSFPYLAILAAAAAFYFPDFFAALRPVIVPLLGLGVALAMKYFSAAAALPGAVFSIWHNLSGATLASHWSRAPK